MGNFCHFLPEGGSIRFGQTFVAFSENLNFKQVPSVILNFPHAYIIAHVLAKQSATQFATLFNLLFKFFLAQC